MQIVYNNSNLLSYEPYPGATCQDYIMKAQVALTYAHVNFIQRADGTSLYLPGINIFPEPVVNFTTNTLCKRLWSPVAADWSMLDGNLRFPSQDSCFPLQMT